MNSGMTVWVGMVGLVLSSGFCSADALPGEESWPSPTKTYDITHRIPFAIWEGKDDWPRPAIYVLQREGQILWTGQSKVDGSAHSFSAVWSPNERAALILDRPSRAECEILALLIGGDAIVTTHPVNLQSRMNKIFEMHGDTDYRFLKKAEIGRCSWINENVARCLVVFSKEDKYELELEVDVSKSDVFSVVGLKVIPNDARKTAEKREE